MAGSSVRRRAEADVVLSLASGAKVADAAKQASVSERTVYRWQADAEFEAKVREARSALVAEAIGKLASSSTEAAATLELLLDEGQPPGIRLAAAKAILSAVVDLRTHEEFEQRLADLEARLGGIQ